MNVSTMTRPDRTANYAQATHNAAIDSVEITVPSHDTGRQARQNLSSGCKQCTGREHSVCAGLKSFDPAVTEQYRDRENVVPPKTEIYSQWDASNYVYTVLEGWVMLYQLLDDGRRQVIGIALPGDLIGFKADPAMVIDHTAEALTDVRLCRFSRPRFDSMLSSHPEFYMRLAAMLERDVERTRQRLTSVGRKSAYERVAEFLVDIFVRVRARAPEPIGSTIALPLIQEQIGDALGLTSVHVNRMMRQLREEGLVSVCDGTMHIVDPDRLAEAAGIETSEEVAEIW